VWIGSKRLILKLSQVLMVEEVEGPFMHPNQRLIPLQKWYDKRDIQLTIEGLLWRRLVRLLKLCSMSMWPEIDDIQTCLN